MEKKTFKLIDKLGYFNNSTNNMERFGKHFTEDKVTVKVIDSGGWIGHCLVIGSDEWRFFKEVKEDTPKSISKEVKDTSRITEEEEVKTKRKIELTEKIFLTMLSNPEVTPELGGEEILEAAIEYASKFIEKLEGGDK